MTARVRAVVVTWNGAHLLGPCLASVLAQEADAELEVLVVDNGSTDGTLELLRSAFPQVGVLALGRNTGFAGGVAAGTAGWDGDAVLLVNNDARLAPGALAALLDGLADARTAAVTARIVLDGWYLPADGPDAPGAVGGGPWFAPAGVAADAPAPAADAVRLVNSTGTQIGRDGAGGDRDWLAVLGTESGAGEVFGFCGGGALLRTSALAAVGGFDPWLFLYYEDTDVSWRLRAAGWTVRYEPSALVWHRHAASSGTGSPVFRYHNTRNSLVVLGRHAPAALVARSWARQAAGLVRAALRREPRPVLAARARGLRDAALALPRTLADRRHLWRAAAATRAEVLRAGG